MLKSEERESCEFFDDLARKGYWHSFEDEEALRVRDCIALWDIPAGSRVLEPGCGRGRLTAKLAQQVGDEGEVVGVDISGEMIAAAEANRKSDNIQFMHGSVLDMPPDCGRFDYILCCNVWPHFVRPRRALARMVPLLKEGGHFWIAHLGSRQTINRIHRHASSAIINNHLLPPAEEVAELLKNSGLKVLDYRDDEKLYWIHSKQVQENDTLAKKFYYE